MKTVEDYVQRRVDMQQKHPVVKLVRSPLSPLQLYIGLRNSREDKNNEGDWQNPS